MGLDLTLKILVVDDMPAMRSILRGMLEELGFKEIHEAEDGDLAWEMLQAAATEPSGGFALVISDWNMPGMTGVDLLRALRSAKETRDIPFLMVTARGDQGHIAEATQAGVTDYVVKPFNAAQLGEKISAVLTFKPHRG
ncbi:response regulator [bacterium]|jgi:two-component system chemotaxis response regulator CheY|nr:response regulator [bacterium]